MIRRSRRPAARRRTLRPTLGQPRLHQHSWAYTDSDCELKRLVVPNARRPTLSDPSGETDRTAPFSPHTALYHTRGLRQHEVHTSEASIAAAGLELRIQFGRRRGAEHLLLLTARRTRDSLSTRYPQSDAAHAADREHGFGPIRRCRRYLRLIDPTTRVWSHTFEEEHHAATRTTDPRRHLPKRNQRPSRDDVSRTFVTTGQVGKDQPALIK